MRYFTIEELSRSDYASANGINNTPGPNEIEALRNLIENVLDPLRDAFGRPVYVNSGYRCNKLNRAVGGTAHSHHLRGMAADISCGTREGNRKLYALASALRLKFTQLIDEKNYSWLHISYDPADLRCQKLRL